MSQKTEIEWFGIDECLPVIPEGHYGVPVLAMVFDSQLESAFPGCGHKIQDVMYADTTGKDDKKLECFANSTKDFDFIELCPGMFEDSDWVPLFDTIVAWAYWPKYPVQFMIKQENTREHNLYKTGDKDVPGVITDRNGEVALTLCKVCGGAESCLPTHCPNRPLSPDELSLISHGSLDF